MQVILGELSNDNRYPTKKVCRLYYLWRCKFLNSILSGYPNILQELRKKDFHSDSYKKYR